MNIESMSLRVKDPIQPRMLLSHITIKIDGRNYEARLSEHNMHGLPPIQYINRELRRMVMREIESQLFEGM